MKNNELKELSASELQERLEAEQAKLQKMKLNHVVSPLDKPSSLTEQRKLVARLHTLLHEKNNNH